MRIFHPVLVAEASGAPSTDTRQGSILVLSVVFLIGLLAATALSVDVGYMQVEKTRMQNAVDAAALAAAQEISIAISKAQGGNEDPTAYALNAARTTAGYVAGLSGVFVDPNIDVTFGQRKYNSSAKTWSTTWGGTPVNVVKVVARRTGEDSQAPGGKLPLFFAGAIGTKYANVRAEGVAYVQARDIAVVHDFSRSMNFDSHFALDAEQKTRMSDAQVIANMQLLWNDLAPPRVGKLVFEPQYLTLSDSTSGVTTTCKFMYDDCYVTTTTSISSIKLTYSNRSTKTFSYSGTTKTATADGSSDITKVEVTVKKSSGSQTQKITFEDTDANVKSAFGLTGTYPFPGGRWGNGENDRSGFIYHCRNDEQIIVRGFRESYGGLCFVNYTLRSYSDYGSTPKLCKARHYPFSAIKAGHEQLCNFLQTLSFDDRLGMVSYDTDHRIETLLNEPSDPSIPYVNISSNPMSSDFMAVNNLMKYKMCNYYSAGTNMGGGLGDAISLLDNYSRAGTQPTILLMTDGNSNTMDRGTSGKLPKDWDWDSMFDYDNDGVKDYSSTDSQATYVLLQAQKAVDKGYIIHTIGVGADADTALLKAVAWLGGGINLNIPGGTSAAEMEAKLLVAFQQIASMVPPAKLLNGDGT